MSTVNERIDKLKEEASDLRKEVRELKDTLQQQNELIISLLKRQNELLLVEASSSTSTGRNVSELIRRFPIASLEDLEKYDAEINEENMQHNIRIMQNLLAPHGLPKNIVNVLTDKVIMETNVDGHHNKKRLLNYGKFIDVMFHACNKDGYSKKEFLNALRKALKNSKNRCHKNNCVARQKLRECNTVAEVPMDIIKTEEIFFD